MQPTTTIPRPDYARIGQARQTMGMPPCIALTATATDDVGVVGVQFKLDGANLGAEDTTAPYAVTWDTTLLANGAHTLSAVARDAGEPLHLIEIGPSAGLNLIWDSYGLRYRRDGEVFTLGAQHAEVMLDCELRGEKLPPLGAAPRVR